MALCPCGIHKNYEQCCGVFLAKIQTPQTPEQLMRSRYTAYSLANIGYSKQTMKGAALVRFNEIEAKEWAQSVDWVDLKIIKSYMETPEKGFVEFTARFKEHNQLKKITELSEFHKENNEWFYVDGVESKASVKKAKQNTARNSP